MDTYVCTEGFSYIQNVQTQNYTKDIESFANVVLNLRVAMFSSLTNHARPVFVEM